MKKPILNGWLIGICLCLILASLACALPFSGGSRPTAPAAPAASASQPPWLNFGSDCQPIKSYATSGGSPNKLDEFGKVVGLLPKDQVTCFLEVQICSDIIARTKVINQAAGESCPPELHFSSYAPQTPICCAAWKAAKASKTPCDPLLDSDCDGRLNVVDQYLLDPAK